MSEILVDSPITGKRESLTQAQFNSYMAQTNGAVLNWIVNPVAKHGEGDQKPHGNWAREAITSDITQECKSYFGTNIRNIKHQKQ